MTDTAAPPEWIRRRLGGRRTGRATTRVLRAITEYTRSMSFASTAEAAAVAEADPATVVRTAQMLGFDGWPALRSAIRSRYLSKLTAAEVLAEHGSDTQNPVWATLSRMLQNQQSLADLLDETTVERVAQSIFDSTTTLVVGSGSFAAPGMHLAHLAQTIGHDVRTQTPTGTSLVNSLALLGPTDCLVVFRIWRTPIEMLTAVRIAAEVGAHVVVVTDHTEETDDELVDELMLVPSEGAGMFASITAANAAVEAVVAAMVGLDREAAVAHTERVERLWSLQRLFEPGPSRIS